MKTELRSRILVWSVILLALLNISTIAAILVNNRANSSAEESIIIDPESSPLNGRYLREELNFNHDQIEIFRQESREFRQSANRVIEKLNRYKSLLFEEIHRENPDRLKTKEYSDSIGHAHSQLKEMTVDFYLKIRKCCTDDQTVKLEKIFAPLFRDNPQMRGAGQGHGRRR
ncbi:MAG: hypothetical protein CVU10_09760 [Bacteroidetes bacterium HGW-Bacteroidetes-5]|jgi:hypothetical protein|nr:MAG: hypothetical protein CVU10_09760 [Bacteroidetes bacterium HGW-Bacteroidetes-5]HBG25178.1 hypothetical protein [Rikenellaceae bacterium]